MFPNEPACLLMEPWPVARELTDPRRLDQGLKSSGSASPGGTNSRRRLCHIGTSTGRNVILVGLDNVKHVSYLGVITAGGPAIAQRGRWWIDVPKRASSCLLRQLLEPARSS